jgi:hypothetical protein
MVVEIQQQGLGVACVAEIQRTYNNEYCNPPSLPALYPSFHTNAIIIPLE